MNFVYIKAMLDCYKNIDKQADALDKKVMDIALKSSGFDGDFRPATHYIKAVTKLTNQKIELINIKAIVLDMIKSLPYKYRQIAKYRYIDCLKAREIAALLGLNIRTIFRLLERLPHYCNEYLNQSGLDDQWFLRNCGAQKWMAKYIKPPINNIEKKTDFKALSQNYKAPKTQAAFLGLNIK
jgi:hypothetical protein